MYPALLQVYTIFGQFVKGAKGDGRALYRQVGECGSEQVVAAGCSGSGIRNLHSGVLE